MMDWTDRHCRFFLRQISRHALLYTEMVTTGAMLHGPRDRLLAFHPDEHPVALQLGGSDPAALAECARIAEELGYDEVNLNVGCPSDRVQSGRFGACLMAEPDLVAELVSAMRAAVSIPVTVKSRIAIDEMEEWPTLEHFIGRVPRGRLHPLHRPCPQGVAEGAEPDREPGYPAAPLRAGPPAEAGEPRSGHYHQWWHHHPGSGVGASGAGRRRHAGAGRVQESLGAGGGRPAFLWERERIGDSTVTKWSAGCCLTLRRGGSKGHL